MVCLKGKNSNGYLARVMLEHSERFSSSLTCIGMYSEEVKEVSEAAHGNKVSDSRKDEADKELENKSQGETSEQVRVAKGRQSRKW